MNDRRRTLVGCTTSPPLMFGDTVTFGLRLGSDAAAGGGSAAHAEPVQLKAARAGDLPYQAPLLFPRTDVAGIDISGSAAAQGLQFDLGCSSLAESIQAAIARTSTDAPAPTASSNSPTLASATASHR